MGRGIGYVSDLWSRDKHLMQLAGELGCAYVSGLSA